MNEPRMIVCSRCGREWNTAALKQCPGCRAQATGVMQDAASFGSAPGLSNAAGPTQRTRAESAVSSRLVEHARSVESLGRTVVVFAWITGIFAVVGGLIMILSGANLRTGGSTLIIAGIALAVQGVVSAVFIALVGRYAQMRAVQAQSGY